MFRTNWPLIALAALFVSIGILLELDLTLSEAIGHVVVGSCFVGFMCVAISSMTTLPASGAFHHWTAAVVPATIIGAATAAFYYGPVLSEELFKLMLIGAFSFGLILEALITERAPKWWLSWVYIWCAVLFSITAHEHFLVPFGEMVAMAVFTACLILFIKGLGSQGYQRGRRMFCLIYVLGLLLLTASAIERARKDEFLRQKYTPLKYSKPARDGHRRETPPTIPASLPHRAPAPSFLPTAYPKEWTEVERVDFKEFEHIEESPDWLVNPEPKVSLPNFAPGYVPSEGSPENSLIFLLGVEPDGSEYLYAEGPINEGAYDEFIGAVDHYHAKGHTPTKFVIHTPGGVVAEGLKIGAYIRKHGWSTQVDTVVSAASTGGFIFISGVTQIIKGEGAVGFHRPYVSNKPDTSAFIEQVKRKYRPYWKSMGATPELYEKMMATDRNALFYVTKSNADLYLSNFAVYVNLPSTSN